MILADLQKDLMILCKKLSYKLNLGIDTNNCQKKYGKETIRMLQTE